MILWSSRRLIGLAVLGSLIVASAYAWQQGVGRSWEATTRLGIDMEARQPGMDLLLARLSSHDLARAIQLDLGATVRATGGPVILVSVMASTATEAIRGANAIADRVLAEEYEVRSAERDAAQRVRDEVIAAAQRHRDAATIVAQQLLERAAAIRVQAVAIERRIAAGGADVPSSVLLLEGRADQLEVAARIAIQQSVAAAPMSPAVPAVTLGLRRIDRAVGATRLPWRLWWTLGSAASGTAVATMLLVVVIHWAREQQARQGGP